MAAAHISGWSKSRTQQDTRFPKTARINYGEILIALSLNAA